MRIWIAIALILASTQAMAASPTEIVSQNTRAVVYLEVRNADGGVVTRGSGFLVTHNGFVLTVAHLKASPAQKLWAVIGQREGTAFPLQFRDADEAVDVAIWQFPQSPSCRPAVMLASRPVAVLDPVLAMGFPSLLGLTPNNLSISNLQTARGFYKTDGYLEPGNSGGPVFNQDGGVVAIVQGGGIPGTENNELIPINVALPLLRKWNANIGMDEAILYEEMCFAPCRNPEHGVASWTEETPWSQSTGWLGGGNNPRDQCNIIANARKAQAKADEVEVTSTSESNKKTALGEARYKYHCQGLLRTGPVYNERRSVACGLWN